MHISLKKFIAIIAALLTVTAIFINRSNKKIVKKIRATLEDQIINDLKTTREAIQDVHHAMLAEKVEQLTAHITNDQEKCIKIAEWISKNISNKNETTTKSSDFYSFSSRSGLCGHRSAVFVRMLGYLNIPARRFNVYNYPFPGTGHSCAQAYYDNQWHYFDPTYAGYFMKKGKVLSFREIQEEAKKQKHLDCLMVFHSTLDKSMYARTEEFETFIDSENSIDLSVNNERRMKDFYKEIGNAQSFGFHRRGLKKLAINFNMSQLKNKEWFIGKDESTYQELELQARDLKLSQFLGAIGNGSDNFQYDWHFTSLKPNQIYSLQLDGVFELIDKQYYGKKEKFPKFMAKGDGIDILEGGEISINEKSWKIVFKALKPKATLSIVIAQKEELVKMNFYVHKIKIQEK